MLQLIGQLSFPQRFSVGHRQRSHCRSRYLLAIWLSYCQQASRYRRRWPPWLFSKPPRGNRLFPNHSQRNHSQRKSLLSFPGVLEGSRTVSSIFVKKAKKKKTHVFNGINSKATRWLCFCILPIFMMVELLDIPALQGKSQNTFEEERTRSHRSEPWRYKITSALSFVRNISRTLAI